MSLPKSFLWHDYESFGADTARDRPSQFAALRTDAELNPVGEPIQLYCQPSIDVLPHPEACLLTGISPQQARDEGVPEYEFARRIAEAFGEPGTCGVGYNSIRFDDELTRHLLYRNFFDPYEREWRGGNSRWDLIDVVRLWHALRPEGLEWPRRADGATSFRLEDLTRANGLVHSRAHEALSDVEATLALARRLRERQPRLFEHAIKLRDKRFAATLLDVAAMTPVLHVSSKIPASRGCLAVVLPLARHPTNGNAVITWDLGHDSAELLELDLDELRDRVFASANDLPEGVQRLPLKGVHLNKSPMLSPLPALRPADAERWGIDLVTCQARRDSLFAVREALAEKVQAVFTAGEFEETDPELSLYDRFLPDEDKPRLAKVRAASGDALWRLQDSFTDPRYDELLFRYRARHFPDSLDDAEQTRWREFVQRKLRYDTGLAGLTLEAYEAMVLQALAVERDPERVRMLQRLRDWPVESGLMRLLGD